MRKAPLPRHVPLVTTLRGGIPECVHTGSIAVVDTTGRLVAAAGDPYSVNFTRSALKPVQALPFIEDGGMVRFGFTSHELAVICGSHSGEPVHLAAVRRILRRIGARVSDLQCGCHPPAYFAAVGRHPPTGARYSPLHHNCSGKHAGFLAYCRLHGHSLSRYLDLNSPLQRRIRATLRRLAPGDTLVLGTDGCSAPNYAMPLARLAHIYCRLACDDATEWAALRFAMTRHPDLVSGTRRTDLALMQAGNGGWVAKAGAGGIQALGIRSLGLGIAIRVAAGDSRALHATTIEVLRQLGLLGEAERAALAPFAESAIRSHRGQVVGRIVPAFKLRRA